MKRYVNTKTDRYGVTVKELKTVPTTAIGGETSVLYEIK